MGDRQDYYDSILEQNAVTARNNAKLASGSLTGLIGDHPIGESLSVNGDNLETVPTVAAYSGDFNLTIKIYADGVLKFTKTVYASAIPFRIPGGYRARSWEYQVEGNVRVRRVDMASSMSELMQNQTNNEV